MRSCQRLRGVLVGVIVLLVLAPASALAALPGGEPLVTFGQGLLDFLTGILGPIIFGLGLAVAAICLLIGSREGLQKAFYAVIGGALLFSVGAVVRFVAQLAR
jgi:hypothetical protein